MTTINAIALEHIPANRLIGLGGMQRVEDPEAAWENVYLVLPHAGVIPDFYTGTELQEGQEVEVTIRDNPIWTAEAAENLPAGTLIQTAEDGRVKNYHREDGAYIGYTTHAAQAGEVVEFVRKYGAVMSDLQIEDMTIQAAGISYPKHVGGGTYELSNGERVRGKKEAEQAEKEL